MTYFIIFLIGFIWITRDIIRVPETFNDSYFKKYKGHWYIDPQVGWKNKGNYHMLLYLILSMIGDLFHLLGTIILCSFFYIILTNSSEYENILLFIGLFFILHGSGVWLGYQLWRKLLNK